MSPAEQPPDTGDLPTIAYLLVASSDSADQAAGTERQRAAIARAGHRLGLTVAEEFIDLGASGITLDGPALRRLLDHITTRPVGYCIVESLDRLSRDPVQQADLDEALSDAGVVIVDASRDIGEEGDDPGEHRTAPGGRPRGTAHAGHPSHGPGRERPRKRRIARSRAGHLLPAGLDQGAGAEGRPRRRLLDPRPTAGERPQGRGDRRTDRRRVRRRGRVGQERGPARAATHDRLRQVQPGRLLLRPQGRPARPQPRRRRVDPPRPPGRRGHAGLRDGEHRRDPHPGCCCTGS